MITRRDRIARFALMSDAEVGELSTIEKVKSYSLVTLGSIIFSVSLVWVIQLCGMFLGGVTGLSQLIIAFVSKFCTNQSVVDFFETNLGTVMLFINVPLLCWGWRGLSKRFVILTVLSIVVQTVVCDLLAQFTVSPLISLLEVSSENAGIIDSIANGKFVILKTDANVELLNQFTTTMAPGTKLLLALIGGFLTGAGAAICLKAGGSTGGTDIVINYLYAKKQISFTKAQSIFDSCVIAVSAMFSFENVLYTLIRLYAYMKTVDMFYRSYRINRLEVVSSDCESMSKILIEKIGHSGTIYTCKGAYTGEEKKSLVIYASNFETTRYINLIKEIDQTAFIAVSNAEIMRSKFIQKTIV